MNCNYCQEQIGDYVDGWLSEDVVAGVNGHIATCPACRALLDDLQAIRSAARSLELHVPPPQVWPRVAEAIGRRPAKGSWLGFRWQMAAASVMGMLLAAGLSWLGQRLSPVERDVAPAAVMAGSRAGELVPVQGIAAAEHEYTTAISALEEITSAEQAALDPDTADVLQAGISVLDTAIAESRAVLDTNPESEQAQDSLFQALQRKVTLLQQMLALINEMRQGNEAGAALIFSELNQ